MKHHTQAQPEALPPSPEQQPDLAPPPQAHAAPMEQQLDVATKQQPDLVPAAQDAPVEPHQPGVPPETQGVTSGQMFAALANVGNLADMYPDSQAELARQAPACEADLVLPTKPPVKDKTQGEPQVRQHYHLSRRCTFKR